MVIDKLHIVDSGLEIHSASLLIKNPGIPGIPSISGIPGISSVNLTFKA